VDTECLEETELEPTEVEEVGGEYDEFEVEQVGGH
jgi:hypothetical protein